jgi:cell wall assembly regulator SMI1
MTGARSASKERDMRRSRIAQSWARIQEWLRRNTGGRIELPKGATAAQIKQAESVLGFELPHDVRESYRLHNGSQSFARRGISYPRVCLYRVGYLMPIVKPRHLPGNFFRDVLGSWKVMGQMLSEGDFDYPGFKSKPGRHPIKSDWWNLRWVPITDDEQGGHLCVDMAPKKGGRVGQLIDWWKARGATKVIAKSLTHWLAEVADELETGAFRYYEGSEPEYVEKIYS